MTQPSSKVEESLRLALRNMMKCRGLTPEDVAWLEQYAVRVIADFNALKAKGDDEVTPEGVTRR